MAQALDRHSRGTSLGEILGRRNRSVNTPSLRNARLRSIGFLLKDVPTTNDSKMLLRSRDNSRPHGSDLVPLTAISNGKSASRHQSHN